MPSVYGAFLNDASKIKSSSLAGQVLEPVVTGCFHSGFNDHLGGICR